VEFATSEQDLARAAVALGAERVAGWSDQERRLARAAGALGAERVADWPDQAPLPAGRAPGPGPSPTATLRKLIGGGADPLGEAFCSLRTPERRRSAGQTFTPAPVVQAMIGWAAARVTPERVVDPGTGSARFLVAAGRRWPSARLVGVETDPLAAMTGRAAIAAAGFADRTCLTVGDYRELSLPPVAGPTLFIGNPPYTRHHQVPAEWKTWLARTAARLGVPASGLAGAHAHFFLATAALAVPGDAGVLVTAAEWLDVNYGALIRALLLGPLGGVAVHVLDPAQGAFADALTSSAITCFRPGTSPASLWLRQAPSTASLTDLSGGTPVARSTLRAVARWGPLLRGDTAAVAGGGRLPDGYTRLGELCRVHRGQVTGANKVWITAAGAGGVPPTYEFPAVTRAAELYRAAGQLTGTAGLRCVIDLPADLGCLPPDERAAVEAFLAGARAAGADASYIARHRAPWWRVRLRPPAPILASYMARRPSRGTWREPGT